MTLLKVEIVLSRSRWLEEANTKKPRKRSWSNDARLLYGNRIEDRKRYALSAMRALDSILRSTRYHHYPPWQPVGEVPYEVGCLSIKDNRFELLWYSKLELPLLTSCDHGARKAGAMDSGDADATRTPPRPQCPRLEWESSASL